MSDKFILQYSGLRFGKTEQGAIDLAERTRKYTSIEIVVTPHKDLEELRTQLQAANERIRKLEKVKRLADNVMIDWNEDRCDPDEFNVLMQFREDLRNAIRACEEKETT